MRFDQHLKRGLRVRSALLGRGRGVAGAIRGLPGVARFVAAGVVAAGLVGASLVGAGCGSDQSTVRPLTSDSFYRGSANAEQNQQSADQGGLIVPDGQPGVAASPAQPPGQPGAPVGSGTNATGIGAGGANGNAANGPGGPGGPGGDGPGGGGLGGGGAGGSTGGPAGAKADAPVSPTVEESIKSPRATPDLSRPTPTAPATNASADRTAPQFLTLGGVVAQVNRTPIYADEVLRSVAPVLLARARDLDQDQFRSLASSEIDRQTDEFIRAEIEYAAAEQNTNQQEKDFAKQITAIDRQKLITDANGSIEVARQRAREQGFDFEELLKQRYRLNLTRVYFSRRVFPRVQVRASELREYYDRNKQRLFSKAGSADFEILKVDIKAAGGTDAALKQIAGLRARAQAGEPMARLAQEIKLPKPIADPPAIERGAYKLTLVEDAVWQLKPGEITQPIEEGGAYYIAKLQALTPGSEQAFTDPGVQAKISETLRGEQFNRMRVLRQNELREQSVVAKNESMLETAVDMAMQNYDRWRK